MKMSFPYQHPKNKHSHEIPDIAETLQKELGIAQPEGNGQSFLELLHLPTLNINGIQSANVGAMSANIIPTKAEAAIDLQTCIGQ